MDHVSVSRRSRAILVAIIAGFGSAGLVYAAPAAALNLEQYVEVPQCEPATGQLCPQSPEVTFTAGQGDRLEASFTANANGCSDVSVRFDVDGYPQSDWLRVSPNQTVTATFTKSGEHVLSIKAQGIEGGCNAGILNSWGGVVRISSTGEAGSGSQPDVVGPAPKTVPTPCSWGYAGPVVLRLDGDKRVELDQWSRLNALGPAHGFGLVDLGPVLPSVPLSGVVLGSNGKGTEVDFSILWYDGGGGRYDGYDFTGDIDTESGMLRGTVVNDAGKSTGWVADQRWACT